MTRARFIPFAVACALVAAHASAPAQDLAAGPALAPAPAPAPISLTQHLQARLPLAAGFTDSDGHPVRLADEFAPGRGGTARPVILVLGYYRCPQLCGLLMQGLLEAAHATGLPASAYRIVFASIDPGDTPADAAVRRRVDLAYARFLDGGAAASPARAPSLALLAGSPASIAALTRSVGYVYRPVPASGDPPADAARFAHPAGIVVVTPDGRISRYLMGVRFDPDELRRALVDASDGRIGSVTDRLALMCAHLDPRLGTWSTTVIAGMRAAGIATMLLLGLFVWRRCARVRSGVPR
jgi:protein SCO1/2